MSEVMRPIAVCVPPETTVRRLRDVFAERNVDVAVVVDAERDLLGTVSRLDLVDAAPDTRTDAVMSSKLHPVAETAPISHAIAIMAAEKVSVVPVVTEDGEVVGLWDANGALRWTAERMGYVMDGVEDSGASED